VQIKVTIETDQVLQTAAEPVNRPKLQSY
jgi:hypothetical protein